MFLHNLLLGVEIFSSAVIGLVILGLAVSTIRTLTGVKQIEVWEATDVAAAMARCAKQGWLARSLGAFDIAFNVIALRGQQDETISTHSYRAAQLGKLWGKGMIWWLDLFQKNHGPQAACGDLQRATARVAILRKVLSLDV